MPQVGAKLHELRRRRDISIRALAIRSGVSHSTISLIERDRMSPSIDTLAAILDALGGTLTAFFLDLRSGMPASPFYARSELVEIGRANTISHRLIGTNHHDRDMMLIHETYAPGADTGEAFSHTAQEAGLVIRGAVEVTVGASSRVLREGDGYYFDSRIAHRFRNVSDEISEIVSAVTPPSY